MTTLLTKVQFDDIILESNYGIELRTPKDLNKTLQISSLN